MNPREKELLELYIKFSNRIIDFKEWRNNCPCDYLGLPDQVQLVLAAGVNELRERLENIERVMGFLPLAPMVII
jgi:hypothetical protein